MQGSFITDERGRHRPPSKAALRRAVEADPSKAELERTAWATFGTDEQVKEYSRTLDQMPPGTYSVVGPDPHTDRRWYATVTVTSAGTVTVK